MRGLPPIPGGWAIRKPTTSIVSLMKRSFVYFLFSVLLACASTAIAHAAETAKVTPPVTQFRLLTAFAENRYVDATTSLAPHATVTLVNRVGMPTLVCKDGVDIEITVASADPSENYIPLALTFQQYGEITGEKRDKSGAVNFERLQANAGKLLFRNKAVHRGEGGRYEFFILVQRVSDGAIGLIDPDIETDIEE